jgi:hypothetical protein
MTHRENNSAHKSDLGQSNLGLAALGWLMQDDDRAARFLALTGLSPDDLRGLLGTAALDRAVLDYLRAHEPDLLACADAIGVAPAQFAP